MSVLTRLSPESNHRTSTHPDVWPTPDAPWWIIADAVTVVPGVTTSWLWLSARPDVVYPGSLTQPGAENPDDPSYSAEPLKSQFEGPEKDPFTTLIGPDGGTAFGTTIAPCW